MRAEEPPKPLLSIALARHAPPCRSTCTMGGAQHALGRQCTPLPLTSETHCRSECEKRMSTRRIEVERFSVTTSKPFEEVVAALKAGIGQLDLVAFAAESQAPRAFADLEHVITRRMGPTGLMLFLEFDHGAVLRKETGLDVPKIVRLVIGNPLVMKEMAKHVPDAGSYAPVTVLVDERRDGVHLSYDRMVSLLKPYGNADALRVAKELDDKVATLLSEAAAVADTRR